MPSTENEPAAKPHVSASLSTVDTLFSADAIEFLPLDSTIFACGTYQIETTDTLPETASTCGTHEDDEDEAEAVVSPTVTRHGRCLLYQTREDGSNLHEIQRIDGPAILDMKWSRRNWSNKTTLAVADAKGHVQLHAWDDDLSQLLPVQVVDCANESTLCLSLDWADRLGRTGPANIVVSLSDGSICTLAGETEMKVTSVWHAHDFEPWIAAFDCWEPSTVWTGGDDLKLKGWDLRQGCERPTFVNKRSFEGGVTTIQSHPLLENIFAVGSYDAHIRLFDRRQPLVPLHEYLSSGGIWRLKWHATRPERLLVAAMHGGFEVVEVDFADGGLTTLYTRFEEHGSLAYGADWSNGKTPSGEDRVASCSFYDHTVHVWSVK